MLLDEESNLVEYLYPDNNFLNVTLNDLEIARLYINEVDSTHVECVVLMEKVK